MKRDKDDKQILKTFSLSKFLHSGQSFEAQEKIQTVSYFPVGYEKQCSEYRCDPPTPAYMDGKKWINICINWRH